MDQVDFPSLSGYEPKSPAEYKEDNNGGGDMGGDAGGVGEMFDYLGDQLLNEIYPGAKDW